MKKEFALYVALAGVLLAVIVYGGPPQKTSPDPINYALEVKHLDTRDTTLEGFVKGYQPPLLEVMRRLYSLPRRIDLTRYFIVSGVDSGLYQSYVQCMFEGEDNLSLYCEAASGYYYQEAVAPTEEMKTILKREGFNIYAAASNYKAYFDINGQTGLRDIAEKVLRVMYTVYGTRLGEIEIASPLLTCIDAEPYGLHESSVCHDTLAPLRRVAD